MTTQIPQTFMTHHDPVQALRDLQHFGEEGGVVPVIDVASTSTFLNPEDMVKVFQGDLQGCYLYSRHSNPSVNAFGAKLAAMEGAEAGLGVSSGMAAITSALLQLMPTGGHILCAQGTYGGTYALMKNVLPRFGIRTSFVDASDLSRFESAVQKDTKVVYVESMSNPLLVVPDLDALGKLCRRRGLKLVVDNTFAPLLLSPARYGADVIVYSCTKYISGGSDLIAGAIVSSREFISSLVDVNQGIVMLTGPVMDPRVAHELYLRLDHLHLRIAAHSAAAAKLASGMAEKGIPVIYPGLRSHPQHALLERLMNPGFGHGGMLVVDCVTAEKAMKLSAALQKEKFGLYAVSLGFSRTLMSCPAVTTSSEIPEEEQREISLSPGLLRLSIGFTGRDEVMSERFFRCWDSVG